MLRICDVVNLLELKKERGGGRERESVRVRVSDVCDVVQLMVLLRSVLV